MRTQQKSKQATRFVMGKGRKKLLHVARKRSPAKWTQTAQMHSYLTEEHPELCN